MFLATITAVQVGKGGQSGCLGLCLAPLGWRQGCLLRWCNSQLEKAGAREAAECLSSHLWGRGCFGLTTGTPHQAWTLTSPTAHVASLALLMLRRGATDVPEPRREQVIPEGPWHLGWGFGL